MCGRYEISSDVEGIKEILNELNERYKDTEISKMKTGEIFPTDIAPVLIPGGSKPRAALMKWGFPTWDNKGIMINARSETAAEKKSFRPSLLQRRCVIPTTGFYEWSHDGRLKTKYLFRLPQTNMLYLAGFYDTFANQDTYIIITADANESIASVHNRMPYILEPENIDRWLADRDYALGRMQEPCRAMLDSTTV